MRDIEVPLAMPVIMAGIRTSAVWVIGTATLSTPIGQTSLGNYIFAGLQTQNWVFVMFGCVAAAALALVVDQLLALMEHGVASHSRAKLAGGALGLALVVLGALVARLRHRAQHLHCRRQAVHRAIRAGGADRAAPRRRRPVEHAARGLGSAVIFNALVAGDIDVYVDYSGTLWTNEMHRTDVEPREDVLREVSDWLQKTHGVKMLGALGFENAYALAMPRQKADALGINSIADLAAHAAQLSIAGDYEFFERPEWKALRAAYGLNFAKQRTMQSDFMYQAAANGDVDVVSAYSSDGRIAKYDLKVLADPRHAIPPYDAILLIAPKRANDEKLIAALKSLVGAIDVAAMREANLRASAGDATPGAVARWLWDDIARDSVMRLPTGAFELLGALLASCVSMQSPASMRAMVPSPSS